MHTYTYMYIYIYIYIYIYVYMQGGAQFAYNRDIARICGSEELPAWSKYLL